MSQNPSNIKTLIENIATSSEKASSELAEHLAYTPLVLSTRLSELTESKAYLKLETMQPTGAFKVRGALTKLLRLSEKERSKGIITASTGNHGAAVSYGLKQLGASGTVFVPSNADPNKVQKIESLGANIRYVDGDPVEGEIAARQYAEENQLTYLPPYNDADVIAGQGTIAVELLQQLEQLDPVLDYVFIALGGGGLTSGISSYLKQKSPKTKIIACSPDNSKVMYESVKAGELLDLESEDTLSDATAGGVEAGSITFSLCQANIDEFINVGEEAIAQNILDCLKHEKLLIEGAAAVAIAGFSQYAEEHQDEVKGKTSAIIICGGNIGLNSLEMLLEQQH